MGTLGRRALIGRRISESLERSGVSQAELGRRLGRAKSAITRWKTGESLPSVDLLLDGLTGIAYRDDSQVTVLAASKLYAPEFGEPGVWIRVSSGSGPQGHTTA